jgi:hypothetical protein
MVWKLQHLFHQVGKLSCFSGQAGDGDRARYHVLVFIE